MYMLLYVNKTNFSFFTSQNFVDSSPNQKVMSKMEYRNEPAKRSDDIAECYVSKTKVKECIDCIVPKAGILLIRLK